VKSDSERGDWGTWAYKTRLRFGLSLEQVAADLGYSDGAVRKTEAGSPGYRPPSRAIRAALTSYYARLAGERSVIVDPAPGESSAPDVPDLVAAILRLAEAVQAQADALMARESQHDALVRDLAAALADMRAVPQDAPSSGVPVAAGR
jgi:transcriptional regulator with XRE-family HTH domain